MDRFAYCLPLRSDYYRFLWNQKYSFCYLVEFWNHSHELEYLVLKRHSHWFILTGYLYPRFCLYWFFWVLHYLLIHWIQISLSIHSLLTGVLQSLIHPQHVAPSTSLEWIKFKKSIPLLELWFVQTFDSTPYLLFPETYRLLLILSA